MPTNREKFLELRKGGVDPITARKQAYGDIVTPVAPVAGVPPAITPPAPIQPPAPIAPPAPVETPPPQPVQPIQPIQPTPVSTPEVAPTTTPVTPEVKPTTKVEKVETPPPPATIGDMYNNLVNRIDVSPEMKALPTFKIAQNRYNKANMYSSMSPGELATEVKNAKLVEGSPAWEDLKTMNPGLVQSVKALNTVNGTRPQIFTYVNNPDGTRTQENNLTKSFVSDYEDNYGDIVKILRDIYNPDTAEEARNAIYTQDVRNAEEKATAIELEMNKLDDIINGIDKDIEKEYAGTGASGSRKRMEKQVRREALTNEYNTLLKNYTTYANKANNLITQNTDLYKSAQEQNKALNTALAGIAMNKYETDLAKQAQEEALNDPATQIDATMKEFEKLGITAQGTTASKIAEFNASGLTLPEYISKLREQFMSKPEYQQMLDKKKGEGVSYQTIGDSVYRMNADGTLTKTDISAGTKEKWAKLDDTTLYNPDTGEIKRVTPQEALGYGPTTVSVSPESIKGLSSRLSGNDVQCGMVTNDYASKVFPQMTRMGDSYESKVKSVESIGVSDVPQVGGVFAMNTYNSNGHTGIVQSVDLENGTFTATDANRAGKVSGGPVTTSTYKIGDNFTFSKGPTGVAPAKPADIEYFNSATPTDKKKLQTNPQYQSFQESKSSVMNDPNADIFEVMKYSQGGKDMGEERLKSLGKFSQGLSQVAELSKKVQETETGPIIGRLRSYNPYDANAQALIAEINSVIPNIARGVYGEVGVLTDADIQNYAKTLPNIKSTEDTNKLVLAMTLKTMLNGFKGQIQIDGSAGRDVSGFVGTVKQYEDRITKLLSEIEGAGVSTSTNNTTNQYQSDWDNL